MWRGIISGFLGGSPVAPRRSFLRNTRDAGGRGCCAGVRPRCGGAGCEGFSNASHGEGGTVLARKRALWPSPCNPHPRAVVARGLRPTRPIVAARREDGLRPTVAPHSPQPTARGRAVQTESLFP